MVFPYKRSKSGLKKEEAGQTASPFFANTVWLANESRAGRCCRQTGPSGEKNTQKFAYLKKSGILKSERNKEQKNKGGKRKHKTQKTPILLRGRTKRVRLPVSGFSIEYLAEDSALPFFYIFS